MLNRVLIAEDDAYLRALFVKAFKGSNFQVTAASDGEEVIHHLNREMPDILVLDLGLPGYNGFDILRYVRRHEHLANNDHTKIIVVTGNAQAEHHAEAALADLFMTKPVSIRDLLALAQRITMH